VPEELKEEIALLPDELDYNMDVKPILSDKCFACHSLIKRNKRQVYASTSPKLLTEICPKIRAK
jgi:hypothetical protein